MKHFLVLLVIWLSAGFIIAAGRQAPPFIVLAAVGATVALAVHWLGEWRKETPRQQQAQPSHQEAAQTRLEERLEALAL